MINFVIGQHKYREISEKLIEEISKFSQTTSGTLYIGYPIIEAFSDTAPIDAFLVSQEYGVLVFDFSGFSQDSDNLSTIEETHSDLYNSVLQKFLQYKPLRAKHGITIGIEILTLVPDDKVIDDEKKAYIAKFNELEDRFKNLKSITFDQYRAANASIQRVTSIKPLQKRQNAITNNSKGFIIKQIESEIANLDRHQNSAAIETPDGPQRIRGLAGSGKTIVLALKAAYLHTLYPDWRIVVTFHTRALYQQFKDLIRRFVFEQTRNDPNWNKLTIIHSWGGTKQIGVYSELCNILGIAPKTLDYARSNYKAGFEFEGICNELRNLVTRKEITPIYDAVLIDEAQDLPQSFFELVYKFTRKPKRIVWAYDELQSLNGTSVPSPEQLFGENEFNEPNVSPLINRLNEPKCDIILPVCYRNTPWTLTVAHGLGFGTAREKLVQFFDDSILWKEIGYVITAGEFSSGQLVELMRDKAASPSYFYEKLKRDCVIAWDQQPPRRTSPIPAYLTRSRLPSDSSPANSLAQPPPPVTARGSRLDS